MTRLRGLLWLTAGIVVAVLAGVVGFNTLSRAAEAPAGVQQSRPKVQMVTAAKELSAYTVLQAENVVLKEFDADAVPEGAAKSLDEVLEMGNYTDLYAGEIIVLSRLYKPDVMDNSKTIAPQLTADQVLMAIPAEDFLSQLDVLKPGDQIDILFSINIEEKYLTENGNSEDEETQQYTFHTLQNVTIVGMPPVGGVQNEEEIDRNAPKGVLVAIDPQDALTLKYAMDLEGALDFVQRAPGNDQTFDTDPVDIDYVVERYDLPIGHER